MTLRIGRKLSPAQYSHFKDLEAEYKVLSLPSTNEVLDSSAQTILEREREGKLTAADVRTFELILLKLLPEDRLRRKAWMLREVYREECGQSRYEAYLRSSPPDPNTATAAAVLADMEQLMEERRRCETSVATRSKRTARVFLNAGVSTMGICFVLFGGSLVLFKASKPDKQIIDFIPYIPPLTYSMAVGALGAFVSIVRRLQTWDSAPVAATAFPSEGAQWSVVLAPVVGAFGAMALFSVFAAALLKGDFFPDFFAADKWMGVSEFLNAASPKT